MCKTLSLFEPLHVLVVFPLETADHWFAIDTDFPQMYSNLKNISLTFPLYHFLFFPKGNFALCAESGYLPLVQADLWFAFGKAELFRCLQRTIAMVRFGKSGSFR